MRIKYFSILLIAIFMSISPAFLAQIEFDGCHYFRNKAPKVKVDKHMKELLAKSMMESDSFDILHYDLTLDVTNYSDHLLIGQAEITYVPLANDILDIDFDLFELTVDSVTSNGSTLTFNYDNEVLSVDLNSPTIENDTSSLTVFYHGIPHKDPSWGGFYFESNYVYNLGIGLSTVPPNFGKVWYPCFDNFMERATYSYHVTSAGGRKAHCQGDLTSEMQLGGDTVLRSYDFNFPIPTYLSAIAVADYETHEFVHTGVYGDIDVTLKAKSNHINGMVNDFVNIGNCIDALEYWFGPYEWERVGYITTTDGALEIPTNIAYPDFMPSQNQGSNEALYGHELGHLWWGDLVTVDSYNNMWLKEGNAEYSEYLFFEYQYGRETFVDILKDNQYNIMKAAHISDDDYQPLSPMPDEHIYGTHTYQKGASVMHNLRGYLGDSLYRQGMQALRDSLAFSYMSPEMMRDIISDATGFDLTDFYNDQIFKPGYAVFVIDSIHSVQNGPNWDHLVYLQQKLHHCPEFYGEVPLEISAFTDQWERIDYSILGNGQFSTATFSTDFEPAMIQIDGSHKLNMARHDLNQVETDSTESFSTVERTDFRLKIESLNANQDSMLVRVNHVWAAPDDENLAEYITNISSTHYWIIDGIIPDGTHLAGKINYRGTNAQQHLDFDLCNITEDSLILVYREDATSPWEEYLYYFKTTGSSTTNASGSMTMETLMPGQYAFANALLTTQIENVEFDDSALSVFPNPASTEISIQGSTDIDGNYILEMFDMRGLLVKRELFNWPQGNFAELIDVSGLNAGSYYLRINDDFGYPINLEQVEIIR